MGIELIIGSIFAAIVAFFGAKSYGKFKGRNEANAARDKEDIIREANATTEAANAQVKVAKNATDIQNEVTSLDDGSALSELRRDYVRWNDDKSN